MSNDKEIILIIDDNEENRYTFSRYLKQDNLEVWTAATGEEGLALAQKRPSLIMLDIQLPDTTGYELCKVLKSSPDTSSIPVLHTSATFTESSDRAFGLQGGADAYLTQPIDSQELTATVRALLRIRAAELKLQNINQELERRVAERTASLQEAVHQLEQFSYAVSHDLRAPLRAMQGYSNALIEDYAAGMNDEARGYLERIASNAARLDKMIVDVLTFTRISRETPQLSTISLKKIVQEVIEHYPGLKAPQAVIELDLSHDVTGNESGLMQAFSNLLGNATKFVSPGITPKVRIWSETRGTNVRVWVEDNGIGIAPEHQGRLFGMFERVLPSTHYEGTGVGLAITRKVVERMGGTVGMESEEGKGSKFWIQLAGAGEKQ